MSTRKSFFTISTAPNTDIWRKPPSTDVFTAPHNLGAKTPLSSFRSARVSFSAKYTERYDQGGLLLLITNPKKPEEPSRWLKTGVEFYNGAPRVSTVGCDQWADWSIFPHGGGDWTTIEVKREHDELGTSLWVYYIQKDASGGESVRHPLREVNWMFANMDEGLELQIGGFAARPASEGAVNGESLEVVFKDFHVDC